MLLYLYIFISYIDIMPIGVIQLCKNMASGQGNGGCRCPGAPMERFMQPCLLILLHGRTAHGYELIQSLQEFGFSESDADPGTVYRNLRRMEEEGTVSSRWDTGKGGPARRIYQLTPEGEKVLHQWAGHISHNIRRLTKFMEKYLHKFQKNGG
jgi:poly-beta-hydroxybutyrate-responsive repressor